jgi:DNA-binding transcriptional ArsR family regulator
VDSRGKPQDFDAAKAELLEAVSHPVRIKILRTLNGKELDFVELGKAVGVENAGQLSFHLAKLVNLVKETPEGNYVLTGNGKEALWGIESVGKEGRRGAYFSP